MKRNLTATIALLTCLTALPLVLAQGPRGGGPGGSEGPRAGGRNFDRGPSRDGGIPNRRLLERINFTDEQFAALETLREDHQAQVQPLREQLRTLHEALQTALESGSADPTAVGQLVIEAHDVRMQVSDAHQALKDGFLSLLTEEQLALLEDFKDRPRRGRRGPRGNDDAS